MEDAAPPLVIASYNCLHDGYVRPAYYPRCDPADFDPMLRHPRLAEYVPALGADVVLLQEVDYALFACLDGRLRRDGFVGRWAHKRAGKPDGCATFVRAPLRVAASMIVDLDDDGGGKPAGHVALSTVLAHGRSMWTVVNTHLKWYPPDAPPEERAGLAQARHLLEVLAHQPHTVVGMDGNAEPGSEILEAFRAAGFADAHPASASTFVMEGRPRKIDYLLHTSDLKAHPRATAVLTPLSALPSKTEPSDHLPVIASFASAG